MGRIISDILTENRLIEYLSEAQQLIELETCVGKTFNAKNLKKMKIINHIKKDPTKVVKEAISTRRIPMDDFPMFTQQDPPKVTVWYLDACKRAGIPP